MKTITLRLNTEELEMLDRAVGALWNTENHQSETVIDMLESDKFSELSEKLAEALEDSKR
jgi:hypothetical protein